MMHGLMGDIRFGLRVLGKARIPSLVMILTLALAVGANTALFSVVHQVLLAPLPFQQEEQLFLLLQGPGRSAVSPRNYQDWKDHSRLFRIAAFDSFSVTLTGRSTPQRLEALRTTHDFLSVLGVDLQQGRFFNQQEDGPGAPPVVVISSGLWRRELASDPAVLGSLIAIDGVPSTVLGILPDDFEFLGETRGSRYEVIVPIAFTDRQLEESQRGAQWLAAVARLTDEGTLDQARQELAAIVAQLRTLTNRIPEDFEVTMVPIREMMVGSVETVLWALLAAVGVVLLVAVLNLAGLMLARSAARQGEFSVRSALGASAGRLARQTVIETLLIALVAGGLGLLLALLTRDLLVAVAPANVPRLSNVGLSAPVLLFSFLVTAGAGVLFGLIPARSAWKTNLRDSLSDLQRSGRSNPLTRRFGTVLVAAEIALAVVILTGAGLLVRSLLKLEGVDPGFNTENALRFRLSLPTSTYDTPTAAERFYAELQARLVQLPGVSEASGAMHIPLGNEGNVNSSFSIEDAPTEDSGDELANLRPVLPGYFASMGIPLRGGRDFQEVDHQEAPGAMIVNQAFVDRYFRDQQALGRRVRPHVGLALRGRWATIVGIVGDVHHRGLEQSPDPEMYIPHAQSPVEDMSLIVRSQLPPENLVGDIQRVVRELDPSLPVFDLSTLEEIRASSLASPRFQTFLFGAFAVITLFLAALGIFGLVSYRVSGQTSEIGVRRALGARDVQILAMVLRHSLLPAFSGLIVGLIGSLLLAGLIETLLYQVAPHDALTLLTLSGALLLTAVLATLQPALQALRVVPLIALRGDQQN